MLPQMLAAREEMRKSLASLPPEQRKKMAAMPLPPEGGDPLSQRMCTSTPPWPPATSSLVPRPKGAECDPPKLNRSGNRTTFRIRLQTGRRQGQRQGRDRGGRRSGDHQGRNHRHRRQRRQHTMRAETQMKYLGSDCGQVKPIEQLAKEAGATAPRGAPARK